VGSDVPDLDRGQPTAAGLLSGAAGGQTGAAGGAVDSACADKALTGLPGLSCAKAVDRNLFDPHAVGLLEDR
jgi:hypothetical protein